MADTKNTNKHHDPGQDREQRPPAGGDEIVRDDEGRGRPGADHDIGHVATGIAFPRRDVACGHAVTRGHGLVDGAAALQQLHAQVRQAGRCRLRLE